MTTTRPGRRRKKLGRPKGSGGPPELVRRHRVIVMLNDGELEKLQRLASKRDLPLGTAAYQLVARGLARLRAPKRRGNS
jgi:hypothetical protein